MNPFEDVVRRIEAAITGGYFVSLEALKHRGDGIFRTVFVEDPLGCRYNREVDELTPASILGVVESALKSRGLSKETIE